MNPRRRALRRLALVGLPIAAVAAVVVGTGAAAATLHAFGLADVSAPGNDSFASAAPVGAGSFDGTTADAGAEPAEIAAGQAAAGERSVWFSWTPGHGGEAVISPVGDRSPRVRVFTGSSLAALTRVDVDAGGAVSVPVLAGTDYRIQVLDTDDGGDFSESLTQPDGTGPDNDGFAAPVNLNHAIDGQLAGATGPLLTGTTAGATVEDGEPGSPDYTVWYSYLTPPGTGAAGTLTLTATATQPSGAALSLEAFTGSSASALTSVAGPTAGPLAIALMHGVTYRVRVSGPEAYFSLTAGLAGVSGPDTTPPVITCDPAPTGWVKALSVPCTASDAASGLAAAADASFTLSATVPPGVTAPGVTTASRSVCDLAGNCADAPVITADVDTQAPAVVCGTPPGDWTSAAVTVTCQASDAGSGLVGPAAFDRTADLPAGSFGSASFPAVPAVCDTAGNCTDVPAVAAVRIDRAPPVVSCDPAPATGWVKDEVSVACTSSDAGSGLASPTDATTTLATSVGAGAVDGDAATNGVPICDLAGNCTTAGPVTGLKVDRSVPVVSCPDDATWHAGTSVAVTCTVTDDGSGLAVPGPVTLTATIPAGTETDTATTGSAPVCDVAGNCATAGPVTSLRLDDKPPTVTCQTTPSRWLDTAAEVTCSVLDAGSGVPSPTVDLTADVAPGSASSAVPVAGRSVCDTVGNCVATPPLAPAAIDRRTPSVTCEAPPAGVVHYEVTVACTAGDADSGLADPADTSFTLGTSVGPGNTDHSALTSTHRVCDVAGNCVTAGPLSADVDRSVAPSVAAPVLTGPDRVTVIAAEPAEGVGTLGDRVPVPYVRPVLAAGAAGRVALGCAPDSGEPFPTGTTPVSCGATDSADRTTTVSFPVEVTPDAADAASAPVPVGSTATVSGPGFSASSPVAVELDGVSIGSGSVSTAGVGGGAVDLPVGLAYGTHTLVLRGTGVEGEPHFVVEPITAVAAVAAPGTPSPGGGSSGAGSSGGGSSGGGTSSGPTRPAGTSSTAPAVTATAGGVHGAPVAGATATPRRTSSARASGAPASSPAPTGTGPGSAGVPVTSSSAGTTSGTVAAGTVPGVALQPAPGSRVTGPTASASALPGPTVHFGGAAPGAAPAQASAHHGAGGGLPWWAILAIVLGALLLLGLVLLVARTAAP